MSRYIDADALITDLNKGLWGKDWDKVLAEVIINEAPSIDIVRCKECKYNYNTAINHGKMQPRCDFTDYKLTENDYCSRGERNDNEF